MLFDEDGNIVESSGVCAEYDIGCAFPTFSIVRPAVDNTRVDMSPYGQSVFADAIDAIQAVDVAFDSLINEVDVSKMRVFPSDVLFDKETSGSGKKVTIPFGKNDRTVFRKVMSTEDMIQEFAPALCHGPARHCHCHLRPPEATQQPTRPTCGLERCQVCRGPWDARREADSLSSCREHGPVTAPRKPAGGARGLQSSNDNVSRWQWQWPVAQQINIPY